MKEGRKPENPEKTPDDELQKMPHTKAHPQDQKQKQVLDCLTSKLQTK